MHSQDIDYLIRQLLGNRLTKDEEVILYQWFCGQDDKDEKDCFLEQLWHGLDELAGDSTFADLEVVHRRIGFIKPKERQSPKRMSFLLRMAAIVIFVLVCSVVAYYLGKMPVKNLSAPMGFTENVGSNDKTKQVTLPDGSVVCLNRSSALFYPSDFNVATRTVYLLGEANFKVHKNPKKPFIVRSSAMSIRALGTEFNVQAYPDDDRITGTLIHGKVKVGCGNGREYILTPNQQVVYDRHSCNSNFQTVDTRYISSWMYRRLSLTNCSIPEILAALGYFKDMHFVTNGCFNQDRYNVTFRKEQGVHEILDILQKVSGNQFDYQLKNRIFKLTIHTSINSKKHQTMSEK